MIYCNEELVSLSDIDCTDNTYRITTRTDSDDLCPSIEKIGIINPPYLKRKKSFSHKIISGFRRIEAVRRIGWPAIPARLLDAQTDRLLCAKLAIADNALQRPLNLIEMSRALHLLFNILQDPEKTAQTSTETGLPASPAFVEKIKGLCTVAQPVQSAVISSAISLPVALELREMPEEEGVRFAAIFESLHVSLNRQREILTLTKEIAAREGFSVLDILGCRQLESICHNSDLDRSQKAQQALSYLKTRRFPSITLAEQTFEAHKKALKLARGIHLVPPKNFEDTVYAFTLSFRNLQELKERTSSLAGVLTHPDLAKILGSSVA